MTSSSQVEDALMSQNKTLNTILEAIYRMATRNGKANQERPEGEKYAELQRIRLGSRLPALLQCVSTMNW